MRFQSDPNVISNICALVLLNVKNRCETENDKMLVKARILSPFPNLFNKFNKTWTLMSDPLFIHNCRLVDVIIVFSLKYVFVSNVSH